MNWLQVLITLSFILNYSSAGKMLVFLPMPWRSHQFVFKELVIALAERGHQIDFYSPVPILNPPPGLNQIFVKDRLKEMKDEVDDSAYMHASPYVTMKTLYDLHVPGLERILTEERAYKDLLQSKKSYDVVINEFPVAQECTAYLAHKFKAPLVAVLAIPDYPWTNELSGLPDNPSYMISYQGRTNDNMNYLERLENAYKTLVIVLVCFWETVTRQQKVADKYLRYEGWENRPPLIEMITNTDLVLVNSHVSISYPYPKAPHVKEVGGIHIAPNKPLPKDLKHFMDTARDGVIYFSLGSVVDAKALLSSGSFEVLTNVFRGLKQRVLWKLVPGLPEISEPNIKTQTWFPQQDILAHNNTVLFITHGGIQSMIETISYGVPTIGIPIFFDQFKDIHFMVTTGMGLLLSFENITESSLKWSISEVLENPRYREQAKKRQTLFHDRPLSPKDEAVYWIEYIMKHGNVLQPAAAKMPFYKLYLLDIYGTVIALLIAVAYIIDKLFDRIVQFTMTKPAVRAPKRKKK